MIDKEALNDLINVQQLSYAEIGRKYNVCGSTIRKWAIKLKIPLSPRKNKDYGTCINCGSSLSRNNLKLLYLSF